MESHVLNVYHQARYRTIGHKIMLTTSESLSSESSCNQNSPEYSQSQRASHYEEESNEGEYWDSQNGNKFQEWSQNQTVNITHSQDSSSDEEEQIDVQEVSIDKTSDTGDQVELLEPDTMEENSLVEGDDYDIIQVFAVDPDLDLLEASSDDEKDYDDYCINENGEDSDDADFVIQDDKIIQTNQNSDICHDGLEINLDTPVVSNVDEYFIKSNDEKHILEVKDEPVVKDVDEYFIKNPNDDLKPPNIEDFLVKNKLLEEEHTDFRIPKNIPNVDEFFVIQSQDKKLKSEKEEESEHEDLSTHDVSINESDLEALPNIEDLKRYLLDDLPYTKFKNLQKSCSVPHSPMHNICVDIETKSCLSFESLNLDLSDLAFENDKDKSCSTAKSDDVPRTLTEEDVNSFLITCKPERHDVKNEDDLSHQDMEIDRPVESTIEEIEPSSLILIPDRKCTSTPIPKPTVLDYCIEKPVLKKESDVKVKMDDFVDVESCNDSAIPVLEANNLNFLLEQFEATEKLNSKAKIPPLNIIDSKVKSYNSLTNGMRLQDAGVQLNKTKMRQILMQPTVNTTIRRSPSPVHSDHDYCSSKKRHSLPNIKGGQSLLKPEVLSSNNRILNSRHRSCKNKKVVYHLSSDDESEKSDIAKKNKNINNRSVDDSDMKLKKNNLKQTIKPSSNLNYRKKISPIIHKAMSACSIDKSNDSVIVKRAYKASDTSSSQNSNGSIKLTIKNKSEVILKTCDAYDNQKIKSSERNKISNSVSEKSSDNIKLVSVTVVENVDSNEIKIVKNEVAEKKCNGESNNNLNVDVKIEPNTNSEHFYTALFSNKQDVQLPQSIELKVEEKILEEDVKKNFDTDNLCEVEQPQKKKKLNLQEYKLRRGANSNNSSATVSPEAIFPDIPNFSTADKLPKYAHRLVPEHGLIHVKEDQNIETPKKIFDPIREASRKILMNTKKQKAEAMRKRDEDIVMSKIPKVENLQLQPLISDAEMLKIVGMAPAEVPPLPVVTERPQVPKHYDEIVMVSVGTNTDENVFKHIEKLNEGVKRISPSPAVVNIHPDNSKSTINFKIKKSDHVLKHNVFDGVKSDRSSVSDKKHSSSDIRMDKERFKDITATLKSVEKQVDTKISSNSLFASIQDTVMKKAPSSVNQPSFSDHKNSKLSCSAEKVDNVKRVKTTMVKLFDANLEHGEDKIILYLEKERSKPKSESITVQTNIVAQFTLPPVTEEKAVNVQQHKETPRKRKDSDMSLSSEGSPIPVKKRTATHTPDDKMVVKHKFESRQDVDRSRSMDKRSRSRDRHEPRYRRSRSPSRNHRRKRSYSRNRSRSRGRYRRYRRSDSPYRRKRRLRSRSAYRPRRSPSPRRDCRSNRTRSKSRHTTRSRSPMPKKKLTPLYNVNNGTDRKPNRSITPPVRKPTVSESSESSTSSSSSCSTSSSSSSDGSRKSRVSGSYRRNEYRKSTYKSPYSSEDRESIAPVEERRIVFVGKLEKDITKASLRAQFITFGPITEVRLHNKEDGTRYGFVTFKRQRDAWTVVESASTFPQYDVGFGGRRDFCRQSYADLDGLEAKYTESAFHGQPTLPVRRNDDMSFEQMLLDMKNKLNKRKGEKPRSDDSIA